jgi:hypothetical protein
MRGCGIDREGVVHYQNTDAEDCGHLQVTAECRLAPFKECTESMFLSAIIDSAILRTFKVFSRNFESTPQFSISFHGMFKSIGLKKCGVHPKNRFGDETFDVVCSQK